MILIQAKHRKEKIMTPKERIFSIRLFEKMRRNSEYFEQIGIEIRYVNQTDENDTSLREDNQSV